MELTCTQLDSILTMYKQLETEVRVKLEALKAPLEAKYGRPVILFVESRTKKSNSLIEKARRYGWRLNDDIVNRIKDIAGLRVIVQHLDDVDLVVGIIRQRTDMRVVNEKDFVRTPKLSGYRSHHLIIEYTVHTPDQAITRFAEIQVRTVGQHFWAVLQHSMMYKYGLDVPPHIAENLRLLAQETNNTDEKMMAMRRAVSRDLKTDNARAYVFHLVDLLRQQGKDATKHDPANYFTSMTILELSFLLGRNGMDPQRFHGHRLARCACCHTPVLLHEEVQVLSLATGLVQDANEPVRMCNVCFSLVLPLLRHQFALINGSNQGLRVAEQEEASLNRKLHQFFVEKVQNPLVQRLQQVARFRNERVIVNPGVLDVGSVTLLKVVVSDLLTLQVDSDWEPKYGVSETLSIYFKFNYRIAGKVNLIYRYPEIEWDEFHEPELVEQESLVIADTELERVFAQIEALLHEARNSLLA
ncbi:GTP pyrophosphokinase [Heliophilum fasciatum]|uniref:PpGpp synthetase/RelA/SpoT-type nucleotidyltransferase n=1 Tax=Heliophilum fasciatum TaxID=35700 RepID=A0A4R2SCJ1_9FIRM|nr:hypothetical protein [Heliophilum fasciatum]MCW2276744.1 ppGpp synthetase/RelA/SpoT-type nucleotidyltransferase [Heliophilum fasciatum]TCP68875.1 ppGpp synthetase/RelA/SpoT-type nucleotidyltransferase [Heliophilum fasciatum]